MIARTEQELRSDVDSALLIRAQVNRRVPVEAELAFPIILLGLDAARRESGLIYAANVATLRFGVNVGGIGGIRKDPKSIAAEEIFPAAVGDTARIGRIAHPGTVILQAAVHMVGILHVHAHVIKLRDRKVVALPPGVSAVVGIPNTAIVAGDQMIRVLRVDLDVVKITVGA